MKVIEGNFGAAKNDAPSRPPLEAIMAVIEGLPALSDDATFTLLVHNAGKSTIASNEDTVIEIIGALELAKSALVMTCLE
jgi:archaellum component FlaG (FlaF/FlaG flagellin family)